jgi:hypothetical protein
MNAYTSAFAPRFVAALVAVGVTGALFSAVVAPAMQPQADGSTRLAHVAINTPQVAATVLVAQADASFAR